MTMQLPTRSAPLPATVLSIAMTLCGAWLAPAAVAHAELVSSNDQPEAKLTRIVPEDTWLDAKHVAHTSNRFVLHLRTLHERRVVFPESVTLIDTTSVELNSLVYKTEGRAVVFAALDHFDDTPILLEGKKTGTVYELVLRASPLGIRKPVEIHAIEI